MGWSYYHSSHLLSKVRSHSKVLYDVMGQIQGYRARGEKGNRTFGSIVFSDFVVTFRCNSGEFPEFFFCKLLTRKYLVRLEGIEPS